MSERPKPTGLLPSEVAALRAAAGVGVADFGVAFGVSPSVVERWETLGVSSGPTALAIRLVGGAMDFEFPDAALLADTICELCSARAIGHVHGYAVCETCHRDPVFSLQTLGYEVTKSLNHVLDEETIRVTLPPGATFGFEGHFVGEGLASMLIKLFKDEPQLGVASWDDAVYVHWIEPGLEALGSVRRRNLIKGLVLYGSIEVAAASCEVQRLPLGVSSDEHIVLCCGLLSSAES